MKEFKPGVLVMIKRAESKAGKKFVGTPHLLIKKVLAVPPKGSTAVTGWTLNPPTFGAVLGKYREIVWEEYKLQIIDPDEQDCSSPSEETLYAPLHRAVLTKQPLFME